MRVFSNRSSISRISWIDTCRKTLLAGLHVSLLGVVAACTPSMPVNVLDLDPGPHLFIDDFLVDEISNLDTTLHLPAKVPHAIVHGGSSPGANASRNVGLFCLGAVPVFPIGSAVLTGA